jgi:hypothetical protein
MLATASVLLFFSALLGCWNGFGAWSLRAAQQFAEVSGYQVAVLKGTHAAPIGTPSAFFPHPILPGLAIATLAIAIAASPLVRDYVPNFLPKLALARWAGRSLRWLRQLHSGNVCDYAAWFTVGAALLCVLFIAVLHVH